MNSEPVKCLCKKLHVNTQNYISVTHVSGTWGRFARYLDPECFKREVGPEVFESAVKDKIDTLNCCYDCKNEGINLTHEFYQIAYFWTMAGGIKVYKTIYFCVPCFESRAGKNWMSLWD